MINVNLFAAEHSVRPEARLAQPEHAERLVCHTQIPGTSRIVAMSFCEPRS